MGNPIDLKGQKFGRLTVLSKEPNDHIIIHWNCECECGKRIVVRGDSLRNENTRSCGCLRDEAAVITGKENRKKPYEALYNWFVRCNKNRYIMSISYEEFAEFTKIKECHYCKHPLYWAEHALNKGNIRYNIDRKDNDKGYSVDNCVPCCKRCNIGKFNTFTYEQWLLIGKCIEQNPALFGGC